VDAIAAGDRARSDSSGATSLSGVRVRVTEDSLEVLLYRWEKVLGLMKDIRVPLADVSDARVDEDPLRETMSSGLKAGLRLPWLYYVARTIRLDRVFLVRRGVPALSVQVRNQGALRSVLVSTRDAAELAQRLQQGSAA
jgi:hypothetical protein